MNDTRASDPEMIREMTSWAAQAQPGQEMVYLVAPYAVLHPQLVEAARRLADGHGLLLFQRPTGVLIEDCGVYQYVMRKLTPQTQKIMDKMRW